MEASRTQNGKLINNKKKCSPETSFQLSLNSCTKSKDLHGAITLYESALSQNLRVNQQNFNSLLYICSNTVTDPSLKESSIDFGFRIYDHMLSSNINPNEASITAVARLAAAKGDGDYAFELVKGMGGQIGVLPRLRSYDPALYCFCNNLEADKAYEVEEHLTRARLNVEESELAALFRVSAETGKGKRVYDYLHKLRNCVRCVKQETANAIESWFCGDRAAGIETENVNYVESAIKDAILRNGGGFHGLGWIGKGKWVVKRGTVDSDGVCGSCGERLACVDIDVAETQRFADSLAALALEREAKVNFSEFQDWLDKHGDYDAVVDGANVGLYQQNFAEGGFSMAQLKAVVEELYKRSGSKWPLVILHNKRLKSFREDPCSRKLLEEWIDNGVLYTTPTGSNDDWYWLYAAVKLKCLLVTNDEMRDHIFELLGSNFFLKWKERHQVRYTFLKGVPELHMPPPFSVGIQESEKGWWHVPVRSGETDTSVRWLCISREANGESSSTREKHSNNNVENSLTGKRKQRSPSPSTSRD